MSTVIDRPTPDPVHSPRNTRKLRIAVVAGICVVAVGAAVGVTVATKSSSDSSAPSSDSGPATAGFAGGTKTSLTKDVTKSYTAKRGYGKTNETTWVADGPVGYYTVVVEPISKAKTPAQLSVTVNGTKTNETASAGAQGVAVSVDTGKLTISFAGNPLGVNSIKSVTIAPAAATANTQLAWFYNAPLGADANAVATSNNLFILQDGQRYARDQLRALKPGAEFLQYELFNQIISPDSKGNVQHNNVADQKGVFAELQKDHPDWFLRTAAGGYVIGGGKYYTMDPGNVEWQKYWVDKVASFSAGYNGVFADNVDASLCGLQKAGTAPAKYKTDAEYTAAVMSFLKYAYTNYFQPKHEMLYINAVNGCSDRNAAPGYQPYVDGVMEEGLYVDWGDGYLKPKSFSAQLSRVADMLKNGKQVITVAQGKQADAARQNFALASSLLIWNPNLYFRYTFARSKSYNEFWAYPDYKTKLGNPLGDRFTEANGKIRRNYANGYVEVDPTAHTATISTT